MADEHITSPNDALPPSSSITEAPQATVNEAPPAVPHHTRNGTAVPSAGPVPDHIGDYSFKRTWGQLILGWFLAIVAFFGFTTLLTYATGNLLDRYFGHTSVFVAFSPYIALVIALLIFNQLDHDLWLSRMFGLQTGPNRSPLRRVLFVIAFGWVALLVSRDPRPQVKAATGPDADSQPKEDPSPKDLFREIAETVVFVIVLVLLLRTFVAEAFVIPTGSMATTLWGYQKIAVCPDCGFTFPVNASSEGDPQSDRPAVPVIGGTCPNCRHSWAFNAGGEPTANTGDRVLVMKSLYDTGLRPPKRGDVVVFKFPDEPQKKQMATNYIKRLCGLPGETIAIHGGKLYVTSALDYSWRTNVPSDWQNGFLVDARNEEFMYSNDSRAVAKFKEGDRDDDPSSFHIFRKPPGQVMAMRRPVYDNEFQPKDRNKYPIRWDGGTSWQPDDPKLPKVFAHPAGSADVAWLRYHHKIKDNQPELISDFLGYNSNQAPPGSGEGARPDSSVWVGDLMLECDVDVSQANGEDEVVVELSKGVDRFRAHFKPATGECTLTRVTDGKEEALSLKEDGKSALAVRTSALKGVGKHAVRFANVDERLLVWVDDALLFGDGVPFTAPKQEGPTNNDLEPASIGVKGAGVKVSGLKLWRDTYYICKQAASMNGPITETISEEFRTNPEGWAKQVGRLPVMTMYVQPKHYLCLGDNSPQSSDSRFWGLVPERLMLGRALEVYFPFYVPSLFPVNRVGPID
jgi:signal peptidase I